MINRKLVEKYKKLMSRYKQGILEDIKMDRHIDATIEGYGATFTENYAAFKQALMETEWFMELANAGKVYGWHRDRIYPKT